MTLTITIRGPRGFYPSPPAVKAPTLKAALAQVMAALDKLPDECEGQKLVDWRSLAITIQRSLPNEAYHHHHRHY